MFSRIGYFLYYSFSWIIWALPLPVAYAISDFTYIILYRIAGYRRGVVRTNLTESFPEKSLNEIVEIEKKFYHHLCDLFIESMQLLHLTNREVKHRFRYTNPELFEELYAKNKDVIVVMGHYGNWEVNISFPLWSDYRTLATYKPLNNPYFDKKMKEDRERFGIEAIAMKNTVKRMLELSKDPKPTLLALIADQAPNNSETDFWVNFLNHETGIFLGPEKIARKINAAVLFLDIQKPKRGFYDLTAHVLCTDGKQTTDGEITKAHVLALEKTIKHKPENWLWSHRRWKRKKPVEIPLTSLYE
jgi:KDO2-lipid IV(A) lauroyltransferase